MKSKNLIIILIALLIVLGAAYFFVSSEKMRRDGKMDEFPILAEIMLRAGEEKKAGNLNIKMLGITEDSRCPIDVKCIWAGKASANVELRLGEITGMAALDTGNNPYPFEDYLIKFVDVKPEKIAGQEIAPSEYTATFSIETIEGKEIEKKEENGTSGKNGIKGFVMMGPICPVQREGDDSCDDKPVQASIVIKDKKEDVIKNIETLDDGSFSVNLSPGNYVIYTDSGGNGLGGSKPEYVTVEEGKFTEVTINIDTGIR